MKLTKRQRIENGLECPECGNTDIEDNGMKRRDELTFRCAVCNHQWDAEEV